MRLFLIYAVVIVAVFGLGYWLFTSSNQTTENLPGMAYEIIGAEHITEGSTDHGVYNSNPPTSGWHWPQPAPCGSYDITLPDERVIHNLEHGGIWIAYKPSVDDQTKVQLKDFANRYNNVIIEPRAANKSNIAVAAWGRLMELENYDETQILSFIRAFMDQGPEKVPCAPMSN